MLQPQGVASTATQAPPGETAALLAQLAQLQERVQLQAQQLAEQHSLLQRKEREIGLRDAKIEKISFELGRLKRWKFGAKTETMSAEQRRLFEETLAEDEAGLRAQLDALRKEAAPSQDQPPKIQRRPRR